MDNLVFDTKEITALIGAYIWPFARIGAMFAVAPIFSSKQVPKKVLIVLAFVCSILIAPLLPPLPAVDFISGEAFLIMINQIVIGAAIGFVLQFAFGIFVVAGQIFAMLTGLGFSMMNSPQDGVQVTVVGQMYVIITTLFFLAMHGHLFLLQMLFESFYKIPIGLQSIPAENLWLMISWGSQFYMHAVMIVMPAIAAMLMVNFSFGVMAKASPQLNPFSIGFIITIILGFVIFLVTLPGLIPYFTKLMEESFSLVERILVIP
ncbi:MAG: flagellar biosynthetic protein FliR [Gammaproteobacteria bacterium]|nr:flagellar biosynthetic protein FliR [Gammaproteobacteria bacterium]